MTEQGVAPDLKSYTLAMDICLRKKLWKITLYLVDCIKSAGLKLDFLGYQKAIVAANLGKSGCDHLCLCMVCHNSSFTPDHLFPSYPICRQEINGIWGSISLRTWWREGFNPVAGCIR